MDDLILFLFPFLCTEPYIALHFAFTLLLTIPHLLSLSSLLFEPPSPLLKAAM